MTVSPLRAHIVEPINSDTSESGFMITFACLDRFDGGGINAVSTKYSVETLDNDWSTREELARLQKHCAARSHRLKRCLDIVCVNATREISAGVDRYLGWLRTSIGVYNREYCANNTDAETIPKRPLCM
jgi:hypothetical protein